MGEIYAENKDEDSFLYIAYGGENTFGGFWSQSAMKMTTTERMDHAFLRYQYLETMMIPTII